MLAPERLRYPLSLTRGDTMARAHAHGVAGCRSPRRHFHCTFYGLEDRCAHAGSSAARRVWPEPLRSGGDAGSGSSSRWRSSPSSWWGWTRLLDEPLRRQMERRLNARSADTPSPCGGLDFHVVGRLARPSRSGHRPGSQPGSPGGEHPEAEREHPVAGAPRGARRGRPLGRPAGPPHQPAAAPGRGRRPGPGRDPRVAGGARGHLPLPDQLVPRRRGRPHVRGGKRAPAPPPADHVPGRQHPEPPPSRTTRTPRTSGSRPSSSTRGGWSSTAGPTSSPSPISGSGPASRSTGRPRLPQAGRRPLQPDDQPGHRFPERRGRVRPLVQDASPPRGAARRPARRFRPHSPDGATEQVVREKVGQAAEQASNAPGLLLRSTGPTRRGQRGLT